MTSDELIDLLRARAADPARRVDAPPSQLDAIVSSMGLGDMFGMVGRLAGDLGSVVKANQAGRPIDPELAARAEHLGALMGTPQPTDLPAVADTAALDRLEGRLGQPLPVFFRRLYAEVADGGFGPGSGLLSIDAIEAEYGALLDDPPTPRGVPWPRAMVPIVTAEPGYECLQLPEGHVLDWDPEGTSEWQDAESWATSFQPLAADLERWLAEWVTSQTPAERRQAEMAQLRRDELRRTKARIAAMTPAEREAMGLPAEGWEAAYIDEDDL